jgi:arginine-tRNA-protein transferase
MDFLKLSSLAGEELDDHLARGWYRMQQDIFTTNEVYDEDSGYFHPVWWLRFRIEDLRSHASHQRMRKRNSRFRSEFLPKYIPPREHEVLYYIYRHFLPFSGYPSVQDALFDEAGENVYDTNAIALYDGDTLIAVGIFDIGKKSGSSILHFYHPAYAKYSLGKYLILLTLDHLKSIGCSWYYPGYVVSGRPRFDYKLFLGLESALYFEPQEADWKPFDLKLLSVGLQEFDVSLDDEFD